MSLAPGDRRVLTEVESRLIGSDPALGTMFAIFAADPALARAAFQEPPPRSVPRGRAPGGWHLRAIILVTLSAMFLAGMTMATLVVS